MFRRVIHEWRSVYEGYKGSWSPDRGYSLPPEDPDKPREVPRAMKAKPANPSPWDDDDEVKNRDAHIDAAQTKQEPAKLIRKGPPPVPAAAQKRPLPTPARKGPPPIPAAAKGGAAADMMHMATSKAAARTPSALRNPATFK